MDTQQQWTPRVNSCIVARLQQVVHCYGKPPNVVEVLRGIDLEIRAGELVLLTGPSGSGKTTLLSILGLLLEPTRGLVEIGNESLAKVGEHTRTECRRRHVSFVFQSFNLLSALTAAENVQVGLGLQGVRGRNAAVGAMELLDRVGMRDRAGHRPDELSCGQKQRVAIARALASPAPLLLADEPTGNLDGANARQVIEILRGLATEDHRAVVIVTHDSRLNSYADRIVHLEDGQVLSDGKETQS